MLRKGERYVGCSILTFGSDNAIKFSGAAFTGHKFFGPTDSWKSISWQCSTSCKTGSKRVRGTFVGSSR